MPTGVAGQTPTITSASSSERPRDGVAAARRAADVFERCRRSRRRRPSDRRARPSTTRIDLADAHVRPTRSHSADRRAPRTGCRARRRANRAVRRDRVRPRRSRCAGSARSAGRAAARPWARHRPHRRARRPIARGEVHGDLGASGAGGTADDDDTTPPRRPRSCRASVPRARRVRRDCSATSTSTNASGPRSDSITSSTPTRGEVRPRRGLLPIEHAEHRAPARVHVRRRTHASARASGGSRSGRRTTPRARRPARRRSGAPARHRGPSGVDAVPRPTARA